jgi:hypothetical protein
VRGMEDFFLSKNFQRKRCLENLGLVIKIILKWFMQTRDVNRRLDLFPLGWSSKRTLINMEIKLWAPRTVENVL